MIVCGARGAGKDVTAHQIARIIHFKTGKPVYININPKKYKLPKYFKRHRGIFKNDSVLYLTDVGLEYYYTEWGTDKAKAIVQLMNICRHKNIDLIWTTPLAADVPLATIKKMDATVYKEPIFRAEKFERYALREEVEEARLEFQGKPKKQKLETAVAFTQYGKYIITDITIPPYWTDELSRAHVAYGLDSHVAIKIKKVNPPKNRGIKK